MNLLNIRWLVFLPLVFCKIPDHRLVHRSQDGFRKLTDWPCPPAEEISPCQCGQRGNSSSKLELFCDGVVDIEEIERVFSVEFPFNNLYSIALIVNDYDLWMSHDAVVIPQNIFKDKTAKDVWISIKIAEVHPSAFERMSNTLTSLSISGAVYVDGVSPIEYFPIYILEHFPNLKWFMLQDTMLSDTTFEQTLFSEMVLPNLGK